MHVRDISSMGICTVTACAGQYPGIAKDQFWVSYSQTTINFYFLFFSNFSWLGVGGGA